MRITVAGIVLIAFIGLLNFHIPHFVIESPKASGPASSLLELVFLANLLGALVAAAIRGDPNLHQGALVRYVNTIRTWLVAAAERVLNQYGGQAEAIWGDTPTAAKLQERFDGFLVHNQAAFSGIGIWA